MKPDLTTFWIVPPDRHGPLGYGVTAFSLADAFEIIQSFGYELPDDHSTLRITTGIRVADLEDSYVINHMGPIVVRGLWYPFTRVGMST
jgi:hypothetical protein